MIELFSKRQKRELGQLPDVFTYDSIPPELRVQIVHIWHDALGNPERQYESEIKETYQTMVDMLRRENGVFVLCENYRPNNPAYAYDELKTFFMREGESAKVLDVIELTFSFLEFRLRRHDYLYRPNASAIADRAIAELNDRFKEHGVGYSYTDGKIIRADSEYLHSEVVKPALAVLRQKGFESALSEYLTAHEHYRHGKRAEALNECYKAFESTMKIICTKRNWIFTKSDAAARLVQICLDNGLIPSYWQSHFTGLRTILESAIPTPRNKQAGHGAGVQPVPDPPDELVSYVLHMTAATILFLTEAEAKLPPSPRAC